MSLHAGRQEYVCIYSVAAHLSREFLKRKYAGNDFQPVFSFQQRRKDKEDEEDDGYALYRFFHDVSSFGSPVEKLSV